MTVFDLEEAELAYSPQFGSAKDAVTWPALSPAVSPGGIRRRHMSGTSPPGSEPA